MFEPRDLELCRAWACGTRCTATKQIDWLAAHKTQVPHRVFLKMNSGMNRLGFTPACYRAAWARLNALPQVDEISLHDALQRRRRPARHCPPDGCLQHRRKTCPASAALSNSAATLRHAADAGCAPTGCA